jgi:hypothetical protein
MIFSPEPGHDLVSISAASAVELPPASSARAEASF